jgi:filamentous hemagglutinin family protein
MNKYGIASLLLGVAIALGSNPTHAEVVPDATLGNERSRVRINPRFPGVEIIRGGAQRDQNLFHSFERFNVSTGRAAFFIPDNSIENIFSRVTGSEPSRIRGTLGVFGNANLFFMNPNGIIFGSQSNLDLGGSFLATTADSIQFENRGFFSALNPEIPALLTINPSAYLFSQRDTGNIVIRTISNPIFGTSGLFVPLGERLSLLGGDVRIEGGRLFALGGQIDIGAVGDIGTIALNADNSFEFADTLQRGNVRFTEGAVANVTTLESGGDLTIHAQRLTLEGDSALRAGIFLDNGSLDRQAGDITVDATRRVRLIESSIISNIVLPTSKGNAGNVVIVSPVLEVLDLSILTAGTLGRGNAGDVIISASDRVTFQGASLEGASSSAAYSIVGEGAIGNGGNVEVTTSILEILDGALLTSSTLGRGNAGDVIIHASDQVTLDRTPTSTVAVGGGVFSTVLDGAVGNGGNIEITTSRLDVLNGSQLSSGTLGRGNAGNIIIDASDRVIVQGVSVDDQFSSGIYSPVAETGIGNGGNLEITTPILEVLEGATLSASTSGLGNAGDVILNIADRLTLQGTSGNARYRSNVSSTVNEGALGDGGKVEVTTSILEVLDGAAFVVSTIGIGDAGNITITASERAVFRGTIDAGQYRSGVFSTVEERAIGDGGNITVTTPILNVSAGSELSASTLGEGNAGNVRLTVSERATFQGIAERGGLRSGVYSNVGEQAIGDGGNIKIEALNLEILDGAAISATTLGNGNAGDIRLRITDSVFIQGLSIDEQYQSGIFSTAEAGAIGDGGSIRVYAARLELENRSIITAQGEGGQRAGAVTIYVSDDFSLTDRSSISTQSQNAPAGDIRITVGNTFSATNSNITTSAQQDSGGNITLRASDIRLYGDSNITTNSGVKGGNITLRANSIIAFDDSDILAFAQRRGGDIRLMTPIFFGDGFSSTSLTADPEIVELDGNDRVDINATGAISGTITFTDLSFLQNNLVDLTESSLNTDTLLANSCVTRVPDGSMFLITGAGGLPDRPGEIPPSPYPTGTIRVIPTEPITDSTWQPGNPIEEPQGLYQLSDGRLILSQECQ